ncbi:MAG: hypothetical protein KAT14_07080 [Candidatus Marinimicrobia bacterium]|nr:hypothetical protein [Candidatus Neomarinimicrobiota bacterium]
MKYIQNITLIMIMIFMIACDVPIEEVYIYHEPYLNIYANVSAADSDLNYVCVYHTTGYGEPDRYEIDSIIYHEFYNPSSGDTITYQTFYIDTSYAVNNAEVYFIHGADSIHFVEKIQGIYRLEDTTVTINVGGEYDLYVVTEEFGTATATELALPPVTWNHDVQDTVIISLSNPSDSIAWSNISGAYNVTFRHHIRSPYYDWTYIFESEEVREPFWKYDTSRYDPIFNPDRFYGILYSEYSDIDTLELTVTVVAYSNSFLDYSSLKQMSMTTGLIRYPSINDFRINIENALGAFTSMSVSDERVVLFIK